MAKNANLDKFGPKDIDSIFADNDTEDVDTLETVKTSDGSEEDPVEDSESGDEEDEVEVLDEDDSGELEEVDEKPPAIKHTSSKEQEKIIALKRELRETREKLTAAQTVKKAEAEAQQLESLVNSYTAQGYDEDTAMRYGKQDFKMQDIERQLAVSNFKAENADLFKMYPEAKANIETIMKKIDASGFTAEQVCSVLYREPTNPTKERAIQAVSGTLKRPKVNNSVSNATRTTRSGSGALTESDKKAKAKFMDKIGLTELDDAEFLGYRERYGI
jgi:hypothetical protein